MSVRARGHVAGWLRPVADVLRATYEAWRDDRCVRLGAGLAFYGLFALVPVLTLAIALSALVFSTSEVQALIAEPLALLLSRRPDEVAADVALRFVGSDLASSLGPVGLVSTLVTASLVFVALQDALNAIWQVPYETGLRLSIRRRLLAFAVVLGTGVVVVASLAAQAVIALAGDLLPVTHWLLAGAGDVTSQLAPLAVVGVALAVVFALLPDADVDRRAAALAGGVTAIAMAVGVYAVWWYLQRFAVSSPTQAAGSVFAVLTAIYVESQVVLAGAEMSKVLTHRWGTSVPGRRRRVGRTRPGV